MAAKRYNTQKGRRRKKRKEPAVTPLIAIAIVLLAVLAGGSFFVIRLLRHETQAVAEAVQELTLSTEADSSAALPVWTGEETTQEETEPEEEVVTEETPFAISEETRAIVDAMTLEEKVAQMFFVTPEAVTGYQLVTHCGDVTRNALTQYPVGGLIFLAKNLETPDQTRQMLTGIQEHMTDTTGLPVFLGLDEEGGRVLRIGSNAAFQVAYTPAMLSVAADGENAVYSAAYSIGAYLHDLGFNLDFAPVADVLTNTANDVIGDRAFSSDPEEVARMAARYADALKENGLIAVYKHFPGHGDTYEDSHNDYAYSYQTMEGLRETELVPFIDGAANGIPMIMVAHISLPEITEENIPATLSREIVTGILREEMGYQGIVITDALDMGAISNHYTSAQSAVLSVQAGCDMLLMAGNFQTAYNAVLAAVENGEITEERIDESVLRIVECKRQIQNSEENR